ncbi:MAG: phosphoglucomutase/phosphomannomutase family protein [Candidatus Gastranaerophilaceae bacterium]|jgi:alpha-D-glucose phosphate-specific phosphoglucomutase
MAHSIKFGTDGWRAIIAEDFTFKNVELVTAAIADYILCTYGKEKPVLVGYDTRFLADKFADAVAEILKCKGLNVLITENYVPTPVLAFSAKNLNTAGALMLTASHNPPEYCGIKYIPDYAGPATTEITNQIVQNIDKNDVTQLKNSVKGTNCIKKFSPLQDYFKHIEKIINFEKIKNSGINICFDPLYATTSGYFDKILEDHGCHVNVIHNWRDPLYGGGMPEPKEKYLKELKQLVLKNSPSVGFSNDGDGDRFGVIDEKGNFITPNQVLAILLKHLIENKNASGCLIKTVAGSLMLDKIAQNFGVEVIETPVGFKWVGEAMRNNKTIIAGEESGGLSIGDHIPEKDGILANLLILEAMSYENKPLYKLVEEIEEETGINFINHRIDLTVDDKTKENVINIFSNNPPDEINNLKIKEISKKDGIKLYFEDNNSWILIRPSGTEPLLRIYFETDSQKKLDEIVDEMKKIVEGSLG